MNIGSVQSVIQREHMEMSIALIVAVITVIYPNHREDGE